MARRGYFAVETIHRGFLDVGSLDLYLFPPLGSSQLASSFGSPDPEDTLQRSDLEACALQKKYFDGSKGTGEGIVFLDGSLYALLETSNQNDDYWTLDMFSLDVGACQREWTRLSRFVSDHSVDIWVACNGKIYMFETLATHICGQVFDREEGEWTEIHDEPMNPGGDYDGLWDLRELQAQYYRDHVAVLGNEIYLGWNYVKEMMVFDTVTEKWRTISNTLGTEIPSDFNPNPSEWFSMTAVNGKLYKFSRSQVEVYTPESGSWTSSQHVCEQDYVDTTGMTPRHKGKELVATLMSEDCWSKFKDGFSKKFEKSEGLGAEDITQVWENFIDFALNEDCYIEDNQLRVQLEYLEL